MNFKKYTAALVTRLALVATVILLAFIGGSMFLQLTLGGELNKEFWSRTVLSMTWMLISVAIWLPDGIVGFKREPGGLYQLAAGEYNANLCKIKERGKFTALSGHCKKTEEENRIDRIQYLLGKVNIDYPVYLDKYAYRKSDKEKSAVNRSAIKNDKDLTRKQKRTILYINDGITVPRIHSASLTSNSKHHWKTDLENRANMTLGFALVGKIMFSFGFSAMFAMIEPDLVYPPSTDTIVSAALAIFGIVTTILFARQTARRVVNAHVDYLNRVNDFFDQFFANEDGKPSEPTDKGQGN